MGNLELIPKHENNMHEKCKVCAHTKITRTSFPKIEKTSSLLHLIHSGVCDMHSNPIKSGKNYLVTFIDDFSKYCYMYLLHSNDQNIVMCIKFIKMKLRIFVTLMCFTK